MAESRKAPSSHVMVSREVAAKATLALMAFPVEFHFNGVEVAADVASFLEAIVLHEHVVLWDAPKYTWIEGELKGQDSDGPHHEPVQQLMEAGVLSFSPTMEEPEYRRRQEVAELELLAAGRKLRWPEQHTVIAIQVAQELGMTFRGSDAWLDSYALEVMAEHEARLVSLLRKAFERVNAGALRDVELIFGSLGHRVVLLPPIAAVVLERARHGSPGRIIEAALELRSEFEGVRQVFTRYEEQLHNDELSLGESLEALARLQGSVDAAFPSGDETAATSLREWRDFADLEKLVDGVDVGDAASLTKALLGAPADFVARKLRARSVSYLSKFHAEFLRLRNYGGLVKDSLGIVVDSWTLKAFDSIVADRKRQLEVRRRDAEELRGQPDFEATVEWTERIRAIRQRR